MYFSRYMKVLRLQNYMTQAEFANKLGISVDAIKKIESGATRLPSSKVLKALSKFTGKNEVEVMKLILYGETATNDPYIKRVSEMALRYLAYMYIHGWNIVNSFHTLHVHDFGDHQFVGEIAKKKDSNYLVLVDIMSKYKLDQYGFKEPFDAFNYYTMIFMVMVSIDKDYKAINILFDYNDEEELNAYNSVKKFNTNKVKTPVYYVLFDSIKCEIVEEHKIGG
ncbi:MAG: helix-turn-helix transcriptional regulator [Erysipelotrichaceae bacterium]|nr:helix-turn-helix transcriptional regulator [Erysipelotrichaceae bacterium]